MFGPQNNTTLRVLTRVTLDDSSHYDFAYTSWGQVWKVSNYAADNHLLNYHSYNLPQDASTAQTDCPRFTERHDWAENWNQNQAGTEQEVVTTYAVPSSTSWTMPDNSSHTGLLAQVTLPDGTYHKLFSHASGWDKGLTLLAESFDSGNVKQRQSVTTLTQDDTNLSYPLNPRVTETNIYDPSGNHARTRATYQSAGFADGTSCNLPQDVYEYQANATTVLRRSHTEYNLNTAYTSRRIIGLPSEKTLYEVDPSTQAEMLMSKVGFTYDESGSIQGTDAPVQHDNTNYTSSFIAGRGNLSSASRYDVTNSSQFTTTSVQYNTAGAVVATTNPLSHQSTISYADSFSDGVNSRNTLAYPTTMIDPDGYSSTSQYNFDFGAATRKQNPQPNTTANIPGPVQTFAYDAIGRTERVSNLVNNAYTRFEYPASQNRLDTYATIQDNAGEAHSFKVTDGHGRVIATAADHPGSSGGFSGQLIYYDLMGRTVKTANPTETSASSTSGNPYDWPATGDDAVAGWIYSQQTYDWKGRPLVTTNQDGTQKYASYTACGCAGSEVATLTDEVGRRQKIYSDVLGRTAKTEVLNWNGSVYATTSNTYNARDQVELVRQFQGTGPTDPNDQSCPDGTCQKTTLTYDGHGRLQTRHTPEQQVDPNNSSSTDHTTYSYNSDDTVYSVTDARGATSTSTYNNRHLVTGITYGAPANSGITIPTPVSYAYDAAGNRTSMNDGMGSVAYSYDQLSRLQWENRHFNAVNNPGSADHNYKITYGYNLAGELTSITDPFNAQVGYNFDAAGRVTSVTGSGFANISTYASNIQYRAWGGQKSVSYNDTSSATTSYNARMQPSSYQLSPSEFKLREQFQYYPDGRLQQMTDLDDRNADIGYLDTARHFSRAHSYDQVGRLSSATGTPATYATFPFSQNYSYDPFNNQTSRYGAYYYQPPTSDSASFSNNRRQGWDYYADGQVKHNPIAYNGNVTAFRDWTYDAAGQMTQVQETVTNPSSVSTYVTSYDGDGKQALEYYQEYPTNSKSYMVRSSVLGGKVLTRLDYAGNKWKTNFSVDGQLVAVQYGVSFYNQYATVQWTHTDPLGLSDAGDTKSVYDPLGNSISWQHAPTAPPNYYPPHSPGDSGLGPSFGYAINSSCILDGIPTDCSLALRMLARGSAEQCPDNYCGARRARNGDLVPLTRDPDTGMLGYFQTKKKATPQNTDCGKFVDQLIGHARLNQKSGKVNVGRGFLSMIPRDDAARQRLYPNLPVSGFQNRLIQNQGGWAYAHITGIAGGTLIGRSPILLRGQTGDQLVQQQMDDDRRELNDALEVAKRSSTYDYYGTLRPVGEVIEERRSEIADDEAGQATGQILGSAIDRKVSFEEARGRIFNLLCDH